MKTMFQKAATVTVLQGEYRVSRDPGVVFSTVLGSCISACIYDPLAGVGGMNHFLLASQSGGGGSNARYGIHAMELLINGLLKKGASRQALEAKVFGGAKMSANLSDIGASNAEFVQRFLRDEGIRCVSSCVRGTSARRVRFHPVSGSVQQTQVRTEGQLEQQERAAAKPGAAAASGLVTLF